MLCENFMYTRLSPILSPYYFILPPVALLTLTLYLFAMTSAGILPSAMASAGVLLSAMGSAGSW